MRTARLTIEPLVLEHAEGMFRALDDERVGTYIGGPDVTTLDALVERIAFLQQGPPADREERWLNFAVLLDGTVIGRVEATVHHRIAEVAYVFGPRWWGSGYATEATAWLLDHLAAEGAVAAWATVTPGNDASVRVLERLGFRRAAPPADLPLLSYDDGDDVLSRDLEAPARPDGPAR